MNSLIDIFLDYARPEGLNRRSYLVGGAVRDLLLGVPLKDIDIALPGDPRNAAAEFCLASGATLVALDETYRIYRVVRGDQYIDFSPLRGDAIEKDLAERDLTINAMALPLSGNGDFPEMFSQRRLAGTAELPVIDPFEGRRDLTYRVIRMVSEDNFVKDPLRLLRAYRFAATLGFSVEVATASAIRRRAALLASVAVERIAEEMRHIFRENSSSGVIESMDGNGLLSHVLPETGSLSQEQRFRNRHSYKYAEHILRNLPLYFPGQSGPVSAGLGDSLRTTVIKAASLLGDGPLCRAAAARLKMSGRERDLLDRILVSADVVQKDLAKAEMVGLLRAFGDDIYPLLVYCISRDLVCQTAESPVLARARKIIACYHDEFRPRQSMLPIMTGDDLIREFGLAPSPLFGKILDGIERAFLEGTVRSRDEAMAAALRMIREESR